MPLWQVRLRRRGTYLRIPVMIFIIATNNGAGVDLVSMSATISDVAGSLPPVTRDLLTHRHRFRVDLWGRESVVLERAY